MTADPSLRTLWFRHRQAILTLRCLLQSRADEERCHWKGSPLGTAGSCSRLQDRETPVRLVAVLQQSRCGFFRPVEPEGYGSWCQVIDCDICMIPMSHQHLMSSSRSSRTGVKDCALREHGASLLIFGKLPRVPIHMLNAPSTTCRDRRPLFGGPSSSSQVRIRLVMPVSSRVHAA